MSPASAPLDWDGIDLVVFDVDGTLYDQRRLRARMLLQMLWHAIRSRSLRVPRIIRTFRRCREDLADQPGDDFLLRQFEMTATEHGCSAEEVREVVAEWIERRPLSVIAPCRYAGIEQLFDALVSSGRTIAVLSDYPADAKLEALGVKAELVVASTDEDVRRLKPDPTGLFKILKLAGAEPQRSLMIGDRLDRDGEVARRAGMRALIRSDRPLATAETFSSYADDVFRPLFETVHAGNRPSLLAWLEHRRPEWRDLEAKAFGYTVVGGLAAIVDLLTFRWLNWYLHPVLLAAAGSFLIASAFQYSVLSLAVYRKQWRSVRRAGLFTVVTGVGLVVNATATAILAASLPITPSLAKIGGIGFAFFLNFLLTTYLVFSRVEGDHVAEF